jgi:hypothetical protein
MKKSIVFLLIIIMPLTAFDDKDDTPGDLPTEARHGFQPGEHLTYDITFGWFNVGDAYASISSEDLTYEGKPCYRFDMYGETSGFFRMINKVKDQWTTYCDQQSLLPEYAIRDIREGRHTKKDKVIYRHEVNEVDYLKLNKKTQQFEKEAVKTEKTLFDLLAGLLFLRTINYDRLSAGDRIQLNAFYNRKFYDFEVVYEGKSNVKTKLGKIRAVQLRPELPDNNIFSGKNAIRLWLSDDSNHIPLKFEVDMLIGSAGIEIKNAKGLKNDVNFVKK